MAFVTGDGILETSTTTGTGTITLAGAVSGYRAMSAAATADGDTFYYSLRGGTEWEVGLGTRASSTTFTRTTVLSSSNAGALVNFSAGTREFWMDIPARVVLNVQTLNNEIAGLYLSNAADTVNDITVATGYAADSTNLDMIRLATTITKQLDAAWAVGTNAGGRDTGAISNGWWYVWLIKRPDTGVVDALFSLSSTAPTMPANYTIKRRIGAVFRSATGPTIAQFTQDGDYFWYTTTVENNDAPLTNVRVLVVLTVPPGKVALFRAFAFDVADYSVVFQRSAETDAAPSSSAPPGVSLDGNNTGSAGEFGILTDASSQIAIRAGSNVDAVGIWTRGWIDTRGKNGEG